MKLYHFSRSPDPASPAHRGVRSVRPRWLLEEIGAEYELVCLDPEKEEHKQPAYLAINPNGTVPTLEDDGLRLFECAAICVHIADQFPEQKLAPAIGTPERAEYYQWLFYGMSEVEPPVELIAFHTWGLPEEERRAETVEQAIERFQPVGRVLSEVLAKRAFLLGERFSAADIVLTQPFLWLEDRSILGSFPSLDAYLERVFARPALERAMTG